MNDERFLSTLGLAMRAGLISLGEDATRKALSQGKVAFVLLDADASDNAKKAFRDACTYRNIPLYELEGGLLGSHTGKPGRMSAAVQRGKMADLLLSYIKSNTRPMEKEEIIRSEKQ